MPKIVQAHLDRLGIAATVEQGAPAEQEQPAEREAPAEQ